MASTASTGLIDHAPINPFHQKLTVSAGLGWSMVGYIVSIIGVATLPIATALHLDTYMQGMVAAMELIGVFFGGFLGGWLTDRFGRRIPYLCTPLIFGAVSLSMYWVHDAVSMGALRVLSGLAVGIEYTAAGSLLTEFLPQKHRGSRLSLMTVLWLRLPIREPISGKLSLAVLRTRNIATLRASEIVRCRRPDIRSLCSRPK